MEPLQVRTSKMKWITVGMILLMLLFIASNVYSAQKDKKEVSPNLQFIQAKGMMITNTKLISGSIKAGNVEIIYPDSLKGDIKEILVKEGQEVKKGQELVKYEDEELNMQIKQAILDKQITEANESHINEKIKSTKANITKITKELSENDLSIPPLREQLIDLEHQKKTTKLELDKYNLKIEELQDRQNHLSLYSNRDGIVQEINLNVLNNTGNSKNSQSLMKIVSNDPYIIEGVLTEMQKGQIVPDQQISITSKAVPGKKWTGKMVKISDYPVTSDLTGQISATSGTEMSTISYYSFIAKLDSNEGLSPGYHVAIQVNLSSENVLVIPQSSINHDANDSFVYVKVNGKLEKRSVQIGITNNKWTEVVSGVRSGEEIVKNPSSTLHSGMEVND
ncbi:efflux RND transporter periplasmic adaptor subunit [Bacillus sp. 1P10SD]|uniref:efflux RND transporter periplasmic adaptor subunit n=1 Tax=Bacillus sp. 1P10SD TaxID=3132265 RepID=UPI0039A58424